MQTVTIVMFILAHASAFPDYLSNLRIPSGLKRPAVHRHMNYKPAQTTSTPDPTDSQLLEPPRRVIAKSKKSAVPQYSVTVLAHNQLANTPHMAVLLKNQGYRLYKKRTIQSDDHWMYWLKSPDGTPLFRVELVWQDRSNQLAEIHLWSWDDKTQISLSDRKSLIQVFGSALPAATALT